MAGEEFQNVFEERAENLSKGELEQWTTLSDHDNGVVKKLKAPGAKLLIGPRGSGKSTLLRTAYYQLIDSESALPAYVNYSHSLALEPLFHTHANALKLFRQWVIHKLIAGIGESLTEKNLNIPIEIEARVKLSREYIAELEKGNDPGDDTRYGIAPSQFLQTIEDLLDRFNLSRAVLLLDDAAHAFSLDQQREFFEIFRQIRSRRVAAKAAIYPGITSYSHSFNVGHEAEILEAWYRPEEPYFIPLMRDIASRRLTSENIRKFGPNYAEYLDILALASFGQPRGFLVMLSQALDTLEAGNKTVRHVVMEAIADYADYVRGVFRSLSKKLPRYRYFIQSGCDLENSIIAAVRTHNRSQTRGKTKSVMIGIKEPIPGTIERIIHFLEYAGILRHYTQHSRGARIYERYSVHYALLISQNALGLGKTFKTSDLVLSLQSPDLRYYYCATPETLVPQNFLQTCRLDLPACGKCGAARIAEEQKFCVSCGTPLSDASVYKELLKAPISELPLSKSKIEGIKSHTKLRTVQDVLLDHEMTIKKVPSIGKVWARRIRTMAEEFLSV